MNITEVIKHTQEFVSVLKENKFGKNNNFPKGVNYYIVDPLKAILENSRYDSKEKISMYLESLDASIIKVLFTMMYYGRENIDDTSLESFDDLYLTHCNETIPLMIIRMLDKSPLIEYLERAIQEIETQEVIVKKNKELDGQFKKNNPYKPRPQIIRQEHYDKSTI